LDASFSCTPNQLQALADGSAVVENFIVVSPKPDRTEDGESGSGGAGGKSAGPRSSYVSLVSVAVAVVVCTVAGALQ
jgi:hypothetical protein